MSKTIAFLVVSLAGWIGISHIFVESEVALIVDNIIQVVGIFGAWWARYKSKGEPINVLGMKR